MLLHLQHVLPDGRKLLAVRTVGREELDEPVWARGTEDERVTENARGSMVTHHMPCEREGVKVAEVRCGRLGLWMSPKA
jgi:hypothetical protein